MKKGLEKRLAITFGITLAILVAEVAGGLISNSLALLSDAGHVLTDAFALGLSLIAARISMWPRSKGATYGYHRVGLVAASINGLSLVFIAGFIFYESFERFLDPPEIDLAVMMPVAVGGFLANLLMAGILGHGHKDLNIKSAWLHVIGDTLSSLGVIISGVVIYYTGWGLADPLAGLLIGAIIIIGGSRVLKESVHILLDMAPSAIDMDELRQGIEAIAGVRGLHHVHLRSLSHGSYSFSAHLCVEDMMLSRAEGIKHEVEAMLNKRGIGHVLLQLESAGEGDTQECMPCATSQHTDMHGHSHEHGHGHADNEG